MSLKVFSRIVFELCDSNGKSSKNYIKKILKKSNISCNIYTVLYYKLYDTIYLI